MDRVALVQVAQSIREHAEIAERVLADSTATDDRDLQLEVLGRSNHIEARLAQLRAGVMSPDSVMTPDLSRRPDNVLAEHTLGARESFTDDLRGERDR